MNLMKFHNHQFTMTFSGIFKRTLIKIDYCAGTKNYFSYFENLLVRCITHNDSDFKLENLYFETTIIHT